MEYKKKSQSFSTDIIVVVVIVLFGAIFLIMNQSNNLKNDKNINQVYDQASKDSKLIYNDLKTSKIIDSENRIDTNKLLQLNEADLKEKLGITGDFAIAFEKDGKLVKIDPENNINCIGSKNIIVNGQSCSS